MEIYSTLYGRLHFAGDKLIKGEETERGGYKHSCALLVSKTEPQPNGCSDFNATLTQIQAAGVQEIGRSFNVWVKSGFSDGDQAVYQDGTPREECHGNWIVNVKTYQDLQVFAFDPSKNAHVKLDPGIYPSCLYNGAYVILVICTTTWSNDKGKGISQYLQGITWVRHGERFPSGGIDVAAAFRGVAPDLNYDPIPTGADDPANYPVNGLAPNGYASPTTVSAPLVTPPAPPQAPVATAPPQPQAPPAAAVPTPQAPVAYPAPPTYQAPPMPPAVGR